MAERETELDVATANEPTPPPRIQEYRDLKTGELFVLRTGQEFMIGTYNPEGKLNIAGWKIVDFPQQPSPTGGGYLVACESTGGSYWNPFDELEEYQPGHRQDIFVDSLRAILNREQRETSNPSQE